MAKTLKPINIDEWENTNSRLDMVIALLGDFMQLRLTSSATSVDAMSGIISLLCTIREDSDKAFNKAWLAQLENEKAAS